MNERLLAIVVLMLFLGTHAYSQDANEKSSGPPGTGAESVPDGGNERNWLNSRSDWRICNNRLTVATEYPRRSSTAA